MSVPASRIYLASRSPRRRELLAQIKVGFDVLAFRSGPREDAEVSEAVLPGEAAPAYAVRVARAKAQFAVRLVTWRRLAPQPILAADTTVEIDGRILGKPADAGEAADMLRQLSGTTHRVLTAIAVTDGQRIDEALSVSDVRFGALDDAAIRRYVATGEPMDKAGAYGIQGRAGAFVEEIRGSFSGIVGLPLFDTAQLLRRFGYPV